MAGPSYEFRSLTISGDFTNSQIKGNYIDCTGATFSMYFYDTRWGSDYTETVQGSSFLNGEVTGTIQNADFGYSQYVITASPAQFSTTGQQIVTFTATVDGYGSQNATKSVNVISSEPTEKFIINAELYEELEMKGYDVYFGGDIEIYDNCTITLIDDVSEDPQEASGEEFYNLVAGGFLYEGLCQISGTLLGGFSELEFIADNNFKLTYVDSGRETTIITNSFSKIMRDATSFTIIFLDDTTFTSFYAVV